MFAFSGAPGARRTTGASLPLRGVRLEARSQKRRLKVDVMAHRGEAHVTVEDSEATSARRVAPLRLLEEAEVVSRELARLGRDRVYEDSLLSAARIQAALTG